MYLLSLKEKKSAVQIDFPLPQVLLLAPILQTKIFLFLDKMLFGMRKGREMGMVDRKVHICLW